jgi:hypothetical protein
VKAEENNRQMLSAFTLLGTLPKENIKVIGEFVKSALMKTSEFTFFQLWRFACQPLKKYSYLKAVVS